MVAGRLRFQNEMSALIFAGIAQAQVLTHDSGELRLNSGQRYPSDMSRRVLDILVIRISRTYPGENVGYSLSVEQQSSCQQNVLNPGARVDGHTVSGLMAL